MSKLTGVLISTAILAAGLTILGTAAILTFEAGMIADATGGVGSSTPTRTAMWITGPVMILVGAVWLPIAIGKRSTAPV
ncbi:hypothetical protein [Microbacterium sp. Root180]|uniref:hypothetical protein n=1 Tax=Microbacterium sp. Root180 TaxID=1736483 RepID=UPI0006F5A686|nr:hypothetical protein [Microbacterium sp. Root180]KRB36785.1 hypothetical protein ASD93_12180 [Microbacterium sp. Root180]